jgi:hypothetical protein
MTETLLSTSNILLFGRVVTDLVIPRQDGDEGPGDEGPGGGGPGGGGPGGGGPGGGGPGGGGNPGLGHDPSQGARRGHAHWLWWQLEKDDATFARIYGFSYDGAYYDLPRPVLFLVHGPGEPAVQSSNITGASETEAQLARAPRRPSLSGVAAAEFGIADDIRVWSYDKADYTIRMDVETGMFEQVLLDIFFDGGGGVSGARVSGARVSGARVSGARVSGARVSGARVGGPRGDASD